MNTSIHNSCRARRTVRGVLPGWAPLESLWAGRAPLFPTQWSARFYLRINRDALVAAGALARHIGRLHVHPERFRAAAERIALDALRDSGERSGEPAA